MQTLLLATGRYPYCPGVSMALMSPRSVMGVSDETKGSAPVGFGFKLYRPCFCDCHTRTRTYLKLRLNMFPMFREGAPRSSPSHARALLKCSHQRTALPLRPRPPLTKWYGATHVANNGFNQKKSRAPALVACLACCDDASI